MSRPRYYILVDRKPVPAGFFEWANWFEVDDNRVVLQGVIDQPGLDPVSVSTVFLGLECGYSCAGPPLLFESRVFGGPLDADTFRYATWEQAVAGHRALTDEALLEGKVAAWQVREQLRAISAGKPPADRQA